MGNDHFVKFENVDKSYDGKQLVVKGLNLDIAEGEFVTMLGPSGSGKTTLLNIISFISRQSSGEYLFNGADNQALFENSDYLSNCRGTIGIMSSISDLIPNLNIKENILLPSYINKSLVVTDLYYENLVHKLNIANMQEARPYSLSSGEKQRVLLCRAMILQPTMLVADEPTSNLDQENAVNIFNMMADLNEQRKTTIIMATHDKKIYESTPKVFKIRDGSIDWKKLQY